MQLNESIYMLAGKYAEALQKKVFDNGNYKELLNEYLEGDFRCAKVTVPFKKSKDKIKHPDFELDFDYFYKAVENGTWVVIPVLNIESLIHENESVEAILIESIHLEFARTNRFNAMQKIIETIWFDASELLQEEMEMRFYTQAELETLHEKKQEQLLPQIANRLDIRTRQVYGRREQLNQLSKALRTKFNKNILLVGASGVGKTALVYELVRQRKKRNIEVDFWETTASSMIKELMRDTGWQDNIVYFCKELSKRGDFLFVRNLMDLFEVGKYEGNSVSIAEFMAGYIGRGEVHLISECTEGELAKIELKSPQFTSYFQVIRLEEPKTDLENIVLSKIQDLAEGMNIKFDQESIKESLRLNRRFTPYVGFPGKPIRFLESLLLHQKAQKTDQKKQITRTQVIQQFCEETGMPPFIVDPSIPMNVDKVKEQFRQQLFGQDQAIDAVGDMLAAIKAALTRTGKPIASFLFVGPTGVGKTEMAKLLAEFMFGNRNRMIRFDMSEYSSPYAVMNLIGNTYNSDGRLTSAVRREPFCVLLFDEIEKAHPNFYDLLLQLLSEGRLTDSQGKLVNFCSTIIIMTSNIGASKLQNRTIGWQGEMSANDVSNFFESAVQKHFRPELYNRIDQVIPFLPLTPEVIRFVVNRELNFFKKREGIRFRKLDLQLDDSVYSHFSKIGYDAKYGARYLQRSLLNELFVPLAKAINVEDDMDQLIVLVKSLDSKIEIEIDTDPLGMDLLFEELKKSNLADSASALRRNITSFKEGHFYVRLLSEINIFERQQKKKSSKFWSDKDKLETYSNLLQTQSEVQDLNQQIETLEMNLSLACLDQVSYQQSWETEVQHWKETYEALKIEFYARRHLAQNKCRFHIYGHNVQPILEFYLDLFQQKNFNVIGFSIWYDADYYNEEVKESISTPENSMVEITRKRAEYIKVPWQGIPKGTKQKGILIGAEFVLLGKAVQLFLGEEAGGQEWKFSDKEKSKYIIQIEEEGFKTPNEIHKPSFYKKLAIRRKVEQEKLEDKVYQFNKAIPQKRHLSSILELLEERFKKKIDLALM